MSKDDVAQGQDRPRALSLEPAHFPGRAPVDSYGNGGFRFADMSHRGSIICVPSGIHAWDVATPDDLTTDAFDLVFAEEGTEVLLIGTGVDLVPLPNALLAKCASHGIRAEPMSTGAAARTFNVLLSEGRAVSAALLAVA